MSTFVVAPLPVALVMAILTLLARPSDIPQRTVSLLGGVAYLVVVAALFDAIVLPLGGESITLVYQVSNWATPFDITFVVDVLSAFLLALTGFVSLLTFSYSVASVGSFGQRLGYHTLFRLMVVGVTGSFLTGDIFNLFVWFEVMLTSSYILALFYPGREHTRAAPNYVVLNLIRNVVMLVAIGGLHSITRTLNMADIVRRLAEPVAYDIELLPTLGLSAVLFSVFTLKVGLAPLQFWVPAAYRAVPSPVTAMLTGVAKKVGIYAVVRLYFAISAAASIDIDFLGITGELLLGFFGSVMFVMATVSIVLGGIGAVDRDDADGILAYSSISQVGFIVLPLVVTATALSEAVRMLGVTAALVYAFNHSFTKSLLFLANGTLKDVVGSDRLSDLDGLADRAPVLATGFLLGVLTLIGVPPLSGFFGKYLVSQAAAESFTVGGVGAGLAFAVAFAGAILTIAYYTRTWNAVFWGRPSDFADAALPERRSVSSGDVATIDGGDDGLKRLEPTTQMTVVVALAVAAIGFGIGFEVLFGVADTAAHAAVDTNGYVDAVLHGPGVGFEFGGGGH